jgi:adenosylcobinamide kinase/adenosylcobinamide-phosphate guanylyltransferase
VATAEALDDEMRERIGKHKAERPTHWRTLEASVAVGERIERSLCDAEVVIIDCLTMLVGTILSRAGIRDRDQAVSTEGLEAQVDTEVRNLLRSIEKSNALFIVITNEVGAGVVPPTVQGRLYRDLLGKANQALAAHADEVYLLVAGIPVPIKRD